MMGSCGLHHLLCSDSCIAVACLVGTVGVPSPLTVYPLWPLQVMSVSLCLFLQGTHAPLGTLVACLCHVVQSCVCVCTRLSANHLYLSFAMSFRQYIFGCIKEDGVSVCRVKIIVTAIAGVHISEQSSTVSWHLDLYWHLRTFRFSNDVFP